VNTPALVIFDMAGTTIEDRGQVPAAFEAALASHGLTITADQIGAVRGASKREAIRSLLRRSGLDEAALHQHADRIYDEFRQRLATAYTQGGVTCVGGADRVIERLRRSGIKVALTTGFDRDIVALLLSSLGWGNGFVDTAVCGDDVRSGRPAPDMIELAMRRLSLGDPMRVANVGDTTLDLESGSRAGVRWNIGVLSGAHGREALERAPHTHLIDSVETLPF
jgi:phosphonatase-like hydrolase